MRARRGGGQTSAERNSRNERRELEGIEELEGEGVDASDEILIFELKSLNTD